MADNSFTFWGNMKEAIDVYEGNPVYQYRMYDALTEYALYGIWPEDDGTMESKNLIMFVQSMVPSIEKSSNFVKKCAESGAAGGRKQKVTDEQIEAAIIAAACKKNDIPSRIEVVNALKSMTGISIDAKTISRRFPDAKKREIAEGTLGQNRDITNVLGTQGQNGDKINVSEGQRDIIDVPEGQNENANVPMIFNF